MLRVRNHVESSPATDDERGATMVEYGIMLALIAAVCIAILITVGQDVLTMFTNLEQGIP